jgi:uncharacterized SAM-binding protein YcdF (DUF218 family)
VTRARLRRYLLILLILLPLSIWLSRDIWLPWIGYALIHNDPPAPADIAVVLAGDSWGKRITAAAELAKAGYVPRILVSGPPYYDLHESQSEIAFAVNHGYPLEWFLAFPNDATSTREEAWGIVPELRRRGVHNFLLVTSNFHTARAGRIFRAVIRVTGGSLEMRVVAAPDQFFHPDTWWRSRAAQQIAFIEWCKTIATFLGR